MSNNNNIDNYLPKKIEEPSDISKRIQLTTELNKENNGFEKILSKPLVVLYEENKKLMGEKEALEKAAKDQQKILSSWMLGQKAMRHLIYDLGEKLGLKDSETTEQIADKIEKILNQEELLTPTGEKFINEQMAYRFEYFKEDLKADVTEWRVLAQNKKEKGL